MSRYTTQVRTIIESNFALFPKDYDFYSEEHRENFEKKFIDHYYFSEIGFETLELFRYRLRSKLNDIMPKYKMIFESEIKDYDPELLLSYREVSKREGSGESEGSSVSTGSGNSNSDAFHANIPQSGLKDNGLEHYMDDATRDKHSSSSTSKGDSKQNATSKEDYERNIYGVQGRSKAQLIKEIRDIYINIDLAIIEECYDLFMLIY